MKLLPKLSESDEFFVFFLILGDSGQGELLARQTRTSDANAAFCGEVARLLGPLQLCQERTGIYGTISRRFLCLPEERKKARWLWRWPHSGNLAGFEQAVRLPIRKINRPQKTIEFLLGEDIPAAADLYKGLHDQQQP